MASPVEILESVRDWQNNSQVEPLVCANDACGEHLDGKLAKGKVVLACPLCGYTQGWVPDAVISSFLRQKKQATG